METSRQRILNKLRSARVPFANIQPVQDYLPVVPVNEVVQGDLLTQFMKQAERLGSKVTCCGSEQDALATISDLLASDQQVLAWNLANIPLAGLPSMLDRQGIDLAALRDDSVRVGITGVDVALASTGSLVLKSAAGMPRLPSLLPPVHIAVLKAEQIMLSLEEWIAQQRLKGLDSFQETSSIVVISGPSRTADIAMQLIMGMHGPEELHIVITM